MCRHCKGWAGRLRQSNSKRGLPIPLNNYDSRHLCYCTRCYTASHDAHLLPRNGARSRACCSLLSLPNFDGRV